MQRASLAGTGRTSRDTAGAILDVSERLAQVRGFNGFSYADVARELGITTASLHYHFPGKGDLGAALVERYRERFEQALAQIDATGSRADACLDAYAQLYAHVFSDERMCLCGMLAAEYETLPAQMREPIVVFFDENESWLAGVLERGRAEGTLEFAGAPRERARTLVGGLEGAMLVARLYGDIDRFSSVAAELISTLSTRRRKAPTR